METRTKEIARVDGGADSGPAPQAPDRRSLPDPTLLEKVLVGGDVSHLSTHERMLWLKARCDAAGLDVRTQPFAYLTLQNKVTLYATKAATDQLIANRRLTVELAERRYVEEWGVYEVRCVVTFPDGQKVEDFASVHVANLRGEALSNATMKCVTKAKRRTVLSACGLGLPDETELEPARDRPDPPAARPEPGRPKPVETRVWGQTGAGPDGRPYHVVVAEAAAAFNNRLVEEDLPAPRAPLAAKHLHGHLMNAAIHEGMIREPPDRKLLTVITALGKLYGNHRDWLRQTLNDFLEEQFRLAREAHAEAPAEEEPDAATGADGGATGRAREPGEEG